MTSAAKVPPVCDDVSYAAALAELRELWGAAPGSAAGDRLDVLLALVDAYEDEHYPIALPNPSETTTACNRGLGDG